MSDLETATVSFVAAWFIRLLRATVRLRHHGDERLREWERGEQRFILAFWHRHLLLMPYAYRGKRGRRISVLVSQSGDGELIARTVARLGIDSSRGSSSRGGIAGMRSLLRKAAEGWDIAFTPDGPRGPASEVQPGVILAAASTGLPIVPVAVAASRAKRLRSWDRFLMPLPSLDRTLRLRRAPRRGAPGRSRRGRGRAEAAAGRGGGGQSDLRKEIERCAA